MHDGRLSDGPGLDFSGFGRARAFVYRASGGPGFFVSGFRRARAFPKYKMYLYFCYISMKYEVFLVNFFQLLTRAQIRPEIGRKWADFGRFPAKKNLKTFW